MTGTKLPIKSPKMESSCDASFLCFGTVAKNRCLCLYKKELPLHNHFYEHNEKLESELALQKKTYWLYYYHAFVWSSPVI